MSVLLLLVPIVGVVCGGLLWPLIEETLSEGENPQACEPVGPVMLRAGSGPSPSLSVSDCGYTTVIHDTLITATGLECDARDPWTAHQFVTTAEEIRRL